MSHGQAKANKRITTTISHRRKRCARTAPASGQDKTKIAKGVNNRNGSYSPGEAIGNSLQNNLNLKVSKDNSNK